MLSYFRLPRFQPLAFFLLSISCFGVSPAALSLTPEQTQFFSTEYLKGCLEGMQGIINLQPEQKQQFCQCTLTNLLKLPDEKLKSLGTLTQEQLSTDTAILGAVASCTETPKQKNQ